MKPNVQRALAVFVVVLNLAGFLWLKSGEQANAAADVANTTRISQIQASTAVTQAQDQQQAAIFNNVLAKFFAEQSFLCQATVAHNATLGGPPAPPGICEVALPTPSP